MFFPNCWTLGSEADALVNSPYGDTCDFLQQDANQSVLDAYPVIIPSGDIQFLPSQIQNLINYTKNGGILVLNQMYLNQFPAGFMQNAQYLSTFNPVLIQNYGHGKIIFYGPDFDTTQLGPIIKQLESQLLPFQVNGNVAYQINRRASSWVITLMNNKGVTKNPFDASVVDESQAQNVQIAYRGSGQVKQVMNWLTDLPVNVSTQGSQNSSISLYDRPWRFSNI